MKVIEFDFMKINQTIWVISDFGTNF